ncbi:SDR family NAD(P)-dependent oxidoreductase [Candidatus Pelagibacter sp. HIMB1321]|uniref:SDR family NAD(P)-dependent oxidoreductase n=1 Tax=Candidatus Pelagibacter sp. HIMB1321 TaxID=1388755 RepID=UPI000A07E0A4|nr:SDR family NAD(P)-dependent oxidoreductase [Candidatus Pelagibacter sp. HIMB1321]SMF79386.1 NDP-sugar epimerase, includes UDP-GlcNAc-inverting 4,6-dehydratase FlaA1 and capsular polysaccharide biosynthesis protein EpsC [Candidatus Pelagibacter sp. HIMB1321]
MIKTIIFGKRSSLTNSIIKKIKKFEVISSSNINFDNLKFDDSQKKNYIFNNFYPSFKLNTLSPTQYESFLNLSLVNLIKILSNLSIKNINKIIYTSSSSVYGIDEDLKHSSSDKYNRKIYSSFKYSSEKIIQNFCQNRKINFYIMRLFNTYGDTTDQFSFIEKLIHSKKNNLKLTLINNGVSLRDFINIDDVALIYKKFLEKKCDDGIYDIGTGQGKLIQNLVDFVNFDKKKLIKKNNSHEISNSIADITRLTKNIGNIKFKSLENYLMRNLRISKKKVFFSTKFNYSNVEYKGSVIYGAGFAGEKLFLRLKKKEKIIFFVDDDPKKQNNLFNNIPIISFDSLKQINRRKIIDKIYIAMPSLSNLEIDNLNIKLRKYFFDVRYLPEKKFLNNNYINLNDLKNDQLNLFLNRKPIYIDKIKGLKKKNILVTGAVGTIGFEICRQLIYQNAKNVVGIDKSEIGIYEKKDQIDKRFKLKLCDINDSTLINQIISKNKIDLIIHAAAYKHVNILEKNVHAAVVNNIIGTKTLCEVAVKKNIDLILISTDKAAQPKSVLGYSKKICEQIIHFYNKNSKKNYMNIVRFGNVFGSSGSAITKFIEQINNNEPLTITNKSATRFFMTILEACYLVIKTTSFKIRNKTFILNMGNPINIYELAQKLGEYKKNLDPEYEIKFIETGLKKNEKLHEKLHEKKEKLRKVNHNVFYVSNNNFSYHKFNKLFLNLEKNYKYYSSGKIINCLQEICKI